MADVVKGRSNDSRVGKIQSAMSKLLHDAFKEGTAGIAASVVPIANIISFGALLFPTEPNTGVPIAIWAMLVGSCIGGVWIALKTSLPPMASGMDSPTVAVLATISTIAGSEMVAAGASHVAAVQSVMLIFLATTVISGTLLFAVGACRLGGYLRFVPYCVVAGFLAAAGCLLISGGILVVTGRSHLFTTFNIDWDKVELSKLGSAIVGLLVLLAIRRWVKWVFGFPVALLVMWALAAVGLRSIEAPDEAIGWYLSAPKITAWSVFGALRTSALTWSMIPSLLSALMIVVIVSFTSLIAKITSIEVARGSSGDLDRELRSHGIASLIAAPFGGLGTSVQPATSLLLEHAGSAGRISGIVSAGVLGVVAIAKLNLPSIVPISVIGALVFYLGFNFITETLWRLYRQQAWLDLFLALVIMAVCLRFGYLIGVLIGLLCSCVIFAINYARIGVLRRQATRADFSSYVEHSPEASKYLRENGHAIRIYWLSGYLFFGSSEGVFERIRHDFESTNNRRGRYVIIDFAMVSGVDSSALFSLTKLRNLSDRHSTILVYSALLPEVRTRLEARGLLGRQSRHRAFADVNSALTWCEEQMLGERDASGDQGGISTFHQWIQHQLGPGTNPLDFAAYLECKEIPASQVLYHRGEPADTIDFVAAGTLSIDIETDDGKIVRLRRMTTHTLVGEMGFFRQAVRSASVSAEGSAILFTLTRTNFERLRRERPELASAFDDFVIRVLAERIEFSNRVVASLSHNS